MNYLLERYRKGLAWYANYNLFALVILLCFFSITTNAQNVSAEVLNGWGASLKLSGGTYDGSVGESAVKTLESDNYIITQGFLQPIDLKVPCGEVELKAYPNPVVSGMSIYAEGCDVEVATVQAYDLFGKLVYQGKPLQNKIDFSGIGVGVYMIRALDAHEKILGVVKVIKTTI